MNTTTSHYNCDKCKKKLKTSQNNLTIVSNEKEGPAVWSRFCVLIEYHHGIHNDATRENADLCQKCAIELLADALKRVKAGERASAGTEEIEKQKW